MRDRKLAQKQAAERMGVTARWVPCAAGALGELVQWDSSGHDWLEGRGEKLYLVAMIDGATSRALARFVRQDSTEESLRLLWTYLERWGRPPAFYTDQTQCVPHQAQKSTTWRPFCAGGKHE